MRSAANESRPSETSPPELLVDRLSADYPDWPRPAIAQVIADCRQDLDGQCPPQTLPELLERLARARLGRLPAQ